MNNYGQYSCLFTAQRKDDGALFDVFGTKVKENGELRFLVYICGSWLWARAENYRPVPANVPISKQVDNCLESKRRD